MAKKKHFCEWVDKHSSSIDRLLPLTHVSSTIAAERIIDDGKLSLPDEVVDGFDRPLLYFFYGRPGYRIKSGVTVSIESSCPCCFIFSPSLIGRCHDIHAFDTGAYFNRLYAHVLSDDFKVSDFSLDAEPQRINRLISAAFESEEAYLDADRSKLRNIEEVSQPWELQGRAYLSLLASPGRNEPDDRICTIEVNFQDPVLLDSNLLGLIVPHTLWMGNSKAPMLTGLHERGVNIGTYKFIAGRHPEFLQAQMEIAAQALLEKLGYLDAK
jgi:hypothetical protein